MEDLRALIQFLPVLERPDFSAGTWVWPENARNVIRGFPYTDLDDAVTAFVETAYETGWVRSDFNWMEWIQTTEAINLRNDPIALAGASSDQLAKLITVCIREDRFSEGALLSSFNSGLMLRIVQRARALLDAGETI